MFEHTSSASSDLPVTPKRMSKPQVIAARKLPIGKFSELGFAKLKGHPAWPARKTGEFGGRIWVHFFGTRETGIVSRKSQGWQDLDKTSLKKYVTLKTIKRNGFKDAMVDILNCLKEECCIDFNNMYIFKLNFFK